MALPFRTIALLILLPSALCSGTDLPEITRVEPPAEVVRDTTATITGNNFPTDTGAITVRLAKDVSVNPSFISSDQRSFLFAIPNDLPLGRYTVRVDFPVIDEIIAHEGSLILEIRGRNLSQDAQFKIDDTDISADLLERDAGDKDAKVPRPFVVEKDDQMQEPNFAKILRLTLKSPEANRWLAGKHTFAIINRDGQRAEWEFEVKPSAESEKMQLDHDVKIPKNFPLKTTAGAGTEPGGGG